MVRRIRVNVDDYVDSVVMVPKGGKEQLGRRTLPLTKWMLV
jgi:hypothetical protein